MLWLFVLESHEGHTDEETAALNPFWTSVPPLPCSSLLLLRCHSLPVTLLLHAPSHAFCLHLPLCELLPPFFDFAPILPLKWSPLSHLFHQSCVSLPLFPFSLASHISPHHYLTHSENSSQLKPLLFLFIWACLLLLRPTLFSFGFSYLLSIFFQMFLIFYPSLPSSFTSTCLPCLFSSSLFHPPLSFDPLN